MAISVTCAKCGKTIDVPDSAAGRKGKCPKCGAVVEVPKAATAQAAPTKTEPAKAQKAESAPRAAATEADPMAALARAVEGAAAPQAAQASPPAAAVERAEASPAEAAAAQRNQESDEVIAGSPVGVQTPTGLPARGRRGAAVSAKWQRTLASVARTAGFVLAFLCLVLGIVAMILLASQGRAMLMPGLGAFVLMLILSTISALGGLLARHILLLLADLSRDVRHQEELLDRISDRLD